MSFKKMIPILDVIENDYGNVNQASKRSGKFATQMHRWVDKNAVVDDTGSIRVIPAGGEGLFSDSPMVLGLKNENLAEDGNDSFHKGDDSGL